MRAPADDAARAAVTGDLDRTMLVEAAAGTGKTRSMVERVVRLVETGRARLSEVAAITFTEAAAAELRERIRMALEHGSAGAGDAAAAQRCRDALDELDDAAISTLHGFASRLLSEHPLEAGLPPVFEVLDDVGASTSFTEAWEGFVADLLDDPALEPVLRRGLAMGLAVDRLRDLALALHDHDERLGGAGLAAEPPVAVDPAPVVTAVRQAAAEGAVCTDPDDRLRHHLDRVGEFAERLGGAGGELEILAVLSDAPKLVTRAGDRRCWPDDTKDRVLELLAEAQEARDRLLLAAGRSVLAVLLARIRQFVLDAAGARRRDGRLGFHDLLVVARDLLVHHPEIRARLHRRFRHVYVDEFQDTDPLQVELAALLTHVGEGHAPIERWDQAVIGEGRLFLVGDPKQSIYRFRRADIALYHRVREHLSGAVEQLTTNFRSDPSVLRWVNHVFAHMMQERPGLQAAYVPMDAARPPAEGARVHRFGGPVDEPVASVRAREAGALARAVASVRGRWSVHDGDGERTADYRDVAVLVPTRRTLPDLERALDRVGVPYRVEARSLLFATQEVRDVVSILRAADDPADEISVVAALRTPALACSDDDLLDYRRAGGRWNPVEPAPADLAADQPVVAAMAFLRDLHEARAWTDVSRLVERVVRDGAFVELACARPRPRDHWRRLDFLVDQARAFSDRGGGTVRQFLDWVALQAEEGATVNEAVVAEPDDDAVRILTVHGAKGLEFPVVFLAGLNAVDRPSSPSVLWDDGGGLAVRLGPQGSPFTMPGYDDLVAAESAAEQAERVRLLYVAATRARDHLVVSLHHKAANSPNCHAARILDACAGADDLWQELDVDDDGAREGVEARATGSGGRRAEGPAPTAVGEAGESTVTEAEPEAAAEIEAIEREAWVARRRDLLARSSQPPFVAATVVAGAAPAEIETGGDVPHVGPEAPWKRGRAGTAVGRAVHATLQSVDLATGAGVAAVARAQAVAEGIPGRAGEVERLVRAALDAPSVRRAVAGGRFWREVSLGVTVEDTTVEGYVDLLYDDGAGLVVVDYKTDRLDSGDIDAGDGLARRYRLQGAAYAAALEEALGRPVSGCVFVFVGDGHPHEVEVADLPGAVSEVRALLRDRAPASA